MSVPDSMSSELLGFWLLLDTDARVLLLDFAKRLIERATFVGGPFNGYPVGFAKVAGHSNDAPADSEGFVSSADEIGGAQ